LLGEGEAAISRELAENLDRLRSSAKRWQARLKKLQSPGAPELSKGGLFGRFPDGVGTFSIVASREGLREVAERPGLRRVPNLGRCPAS
jgi:hypothetical protein